MKNYINLNKEFLNNVNIFVGPVSINVIDTIKKFTSNEGIKIGFIVSRRQVDMDGGYVNNWNTKDFAEYAESENVILCRDHGGISQGTIYDDGISSLIEDSKYFKILHIDPWLKYNNFEDAIKETINNIKIICSINNNCLFEVGTEQAIFEYDEIMLNEFLKRLKNELGELFDRIAYCVVQSGTAIEGTKNIGTFDKNRLLRMLEICKKYGIKSKEHNGDYLSIKQITEKFECGLNAINIAPEFGVIETDIILEHMNEYQKEEFFQMCLKSNKWKKWVNKEFDQNKNKIELIRICGHYQFSTPEFKALNINIDDVIQKKLYDKLLELTKYNDT